MVGIIICMVGITICTRTGIDSVHPDYLPGPGTISCFSPVQVNFRGAGQDVA